MSHQGQRNSSFKFLAALVALVVLGISGVGFLVAASATSNLKHTQAFDAQSEAFPSDGGTNILLVGSDNREGMSKKDRKKYKVGLDDYGRQTDTIMIAHLADNGTVGMVSIPRDSLVTIPAHTSDGQSRPASKNKINAAYAIGGAPLLVNTVEQNTGVHIDHYAEINFMGFVSMVDALGGVPICVKKPIQDEKAGLNLPAGTTDLDGQQALAFVRARYFDPTADIGRMQRQQTFLGAMFKKATSPSVVLNPFKSYSFLRNLSGAITVDETMGRQEVFGLISQVGALSPSSITFKSLPVGEAFDEPGVGSVVTWKQPETDEIFALLKTGEPLAKSSSKSSAQTVEVAPAAIRVAVYNGTTTAGLATKVQNGLKSEGFVTVGVPSNSTTKTDGPVIIQYDPNYDTSLKTLQAALPGAETQEVPGLGKTFKVIAGPDFNGVTPVKVAGSSSSNGSNDSGNSDGSKSAADNVCS